MKKYYKVIDRGQLIDRDYNQRMRSCVVVSDISRAIEYKPGEWVTAPENTRLFVFSAKREARDFLQQVSRRYPARQYEMWECAARGGFRGWGAWHACNSGHLWMLVNSYLESHKKVNWKAISNQLQLHPIETTFVKAVKLIKKVK